MKAGLRQLLMAQTDRFAGPFDTPSGDVSPKFAVLSAANNILVITPKQSGTAAVLAQLVRSSVTASSSLGGSQELWRRATTRNILGAWIRKKTASATSGAGWSTATLSLSGHHAGATGGTQLDYQTTSTNGDYIEYSVVIGSGGKFTLGFYKTGITSLSATVSIPAEGGFTPVVVNTRRPGADNIIVEEEFTFQAGTYTVRIAHTGAGGAPLYIFGANFRSILSANAFDAGNTGHDSYAYVYDANDYVNGSGANDYAIFSKTDQKWGGSFHGGETATVPAVMRMDGANVTLASGIPITGYRFQIEQQTHIQWSRESLDVSSLTSFEVDGHATFSALMVGDVVCETFIAGMSAAYATETAGAFTGGFSELTAPEAVTYSAVGFDGLPIARKYTQRNPTTSQEITCSITEFRRYDRSIYSGPFIWATTAAPYFKFYNAPVYGYTAGVRLRQAQFAFDAEFV